MPVRSSPSSSSSSSSSTRGVAASLVAALAVAVLLVVAAVPVVRAFATLSEHRVHYLDSFERSDGVRNYLFRSDMPGDGHGNFAYAELQQFMRARAAAEANVTLPDYDLFVIDVSFLNALTNGADLQVERDYFAANPAHGRLVNWVLVGNLVDPASLPAAARTSLAKRYPEWDVVDKLVERTELLRTELLASTEVARSIAVLVHCSAGEDRTGEAAGAYSIRWRNQSFHTALAFDDHVESRLIHKASMFAFNWYCYYLNEVRGFDNNCTVPRNETGGHLWAEHDSADDDDDDDDHHHHHHHVGARSHAHARITV